MIEEREKRRREGEIAGRDAAAVVGDEVGERAVPAEGRVIVFVGLVKDHARPLVAERGVVHAGVEIGVGGLLSVERGCRREEEEQTEPAYAARSFGKHSGSP